MDIKKEAMRVISSLYGENAQFREGQYEAKKPLDQSPKQLIFF